MDIERQARYRWAAELFSGARVLDAACGAGEGTALLAARAGGVVGVDLSPAVLAVAADAHGDVAEFREGDLRALPFDPGEFDHAVCFEALAHVADPSRALDELRRVLRPGGALLVSAPNPSAYPPGNPLHLSEITPEQLERLLAARFDNVAVHRQQTRFATLLGEVAGEVRTDPLPAGGELHAVAAASDGELPPSPASLVLGEAVDPIAQERLLAQWRERAIGAEAEVEALRRELRSRQS